MSLQKLCGRLSLVIFFALALVPTVLFGVNGPSPGRKIAMPSPAPFPHRLSQDALKEFGTWYGQHIGLRALLEYIGLEYNLVLLRWPIVPQIAFGSHGWLFYNEDEGDAAMLDFRGWLRFRPEEIATIETALKTAHDGLAACGIGFLVVVVPDKQSIYGQFLGGDEALVRTRLDDLLNRLDASARATILDLRPVLRAEAAKHAPLAIYLKTDSHWNGLGAFYAYRAILERLDEQATVSRLDLAALDNFTIVEQPSDGGDIARILLMPWLFPEIELSLHLNASMPRVEVPNSNQIVYRSTDDPGGGPLLIFGDSFAPSLAEPLARHYGSVYVRSPSFDAGAVGRLKPRFVVWETVARYARRLIKPISHIERACAR